MNRIPGPTIGSNDTFTFNVCWNKRNQFSRQTVFNYLKPEPAQLAALAFKGDRNCTFVISHATTLATWLATNAELFGLHVAGKLFSALTDSAASQLLKPNTRWSVTSKSQKTSRLTALTPDFLVVNHHIALNHTVSGFRVTGIIVLVVNECWCSHRMQITRPFALFQKSLFPQRSQIYPSGHLQWKR